MSIRANVGVGSEFLGYRLEELIGQGGMGVVYCAYDLRLKRAVALKFIAPGRALDERFRERFLRESELAASLEHPNVVPIHDAGEVDGHLYLTMRYVEGTDLRRLLEAEGAVEPSRAIAICRQVGSALDAAHARGLVHRDVKPSNVLLDENEHAYLADFGLTRRLEEQGVQRGEGRSIGTPAYLAPEQIEGGPVDGRADVYSLGCVLFECLTGAPPYVRPSPLAVAWGHLEEEPPSASERNSELPQALDAVLQNALAKEPDDRYPTCAALLVAAGDALGFSRAPVLLRRRLALSVAAAIVVASAAAIATVLATRDGSTPARAALFAGPNTLARIDPSTNNVSNVIRVGSLPSAMAIAGHTVWVYNRADSTVSEVDARTGTIRQTTRLLAAADEVSVFSGPVLTADAGGAWFAGVGIADPARFLLTRIRTDGSKRVYRLDHEPRGIALGFGAVWVAARAFGDDQLMRIDPLTGRVDRRIRFGSKPIDSIGVGDGAVWVVGSDSGTLYRVDPNSGRRREVDVGTHASRPAVWPGTVYIETTDNGGTTTLINPRTLSVSNQNPTCCPPNWGQSVHLNGWLWSDDWPTGSVYRWHFTSAAPAHHVRVVRTLPAAGGPCLTTIAIGAGAVWVTVAAETPLLTCH